MKILFTLFSLLASPALASFTLTVSTLGPRGNAVIISSNPTTGINCGSSNTTCSASFPSGSTVTLNIIAASTTIFVGWGGAFTGCPTNLKTCKILMSDDESISAQFNPVLSLSLSGNGAGDVADASSTIDCNASGGGCASGSFVDQSYFSGTFITLTASASVNSSFIGWSGSACSGSSPSCHFNISSYQTAIATFSSVGPFNINVSKGGTGRGTVTSSPAGINCGGICTASFALNTSITLVAVSSAGYTFAGWSGAGCSGTGSCVINSTSTQQGTGGQYSPSATFY